MAHPPRRRGFTLVELMVTVVIIGVLAAIAIPSVQNQIYRSYTSEASSFLADIRKQQDSYMTEYGQYCNICQDSNTNMDGLTADLFTPTSVPTDPTAFAGDCDSDWDQLGASPNGAVRFQYAVIAGDPGTSVTPSTLNITTTDYFWVAQARADLDIDGTRVTFETYSENTHIYISDQKGWE